MGLFLGGDPGDIMIIPYYADNEICLQEVRFYVPASEWTEFENSQLFHDLEEYMARLKTQDIRTYSRESQYTQEKLQLMQIQNADIHHGSFWALFRKWLLHK